jgi:hypothetical protein
LCDCAYLSVNSMLIKTLQANLTVWECSKKLITIMPVFIRLTINNNKKKQLAGQLCCWEIWKFLCFSKSICRRHLAYFRRWFSVFGKMFTNTDLTFFNFVWKLLITLFGKSRSNSILKTLIFRSDSKVSYDEVDIRCHNHAQNKTKHPVFCLLITIMPVFIRLTINNNKKKTIGRPILLLRNLKVPLF